MQQNCRMGPIRVEGEVRYAFVIIEDVTEAVENERKLADAAVRDVLTGAYNRRRFEERFDDEVRRAERYGRGLALILLDIDRFKSVNDELGHPFGDEALREVALRCGSVVRSTDVLCRYGGEEFCVVLPETDLARASALAERLRAACGDEPVRYLGMERTLTISLGVAAWRPGEAPSELVSRADGALYAAKRGGRNRVEIDP
jgi:diguanylate cyclase (GGDEF)-like protein